MKRGRLLFAANDDNEKISKKIQKKIKIRKSKNNKKPRIKASVVSAISISENNHYRVRDVELLISEDFGKDNHEATWPLIKAVGKYLGFKGSEWKRLVDTEKVGDFIVVRKSFDSRKKNLKFVYTVDMTISSRVIERIRDHKDKVSPTEATPLATYLDDEELLDKRSKIKIVIVGAGPAGLFAALTLVNAGFQPIIIERGKSVEQRGKSIGALFNRKLLDPESNLCYGEGPL